MSSKVRVYEVARDLGMDNKALVTLFQSVGVSEVRNHMSAVAPEAVERVKRHLEKQKAEKVVEERIRPTVVKRRVKKRQSEAGASSDCAAHRRGRHQDGEGQRWMGIHKAPRRPSKPRS